MSSIFIIFSFHYLSPLLLFVPKLFMHVVTYFNLQKSLQYVTSKSQQYQSALLFQSQVKTLWSSAKLLHFLRNKANIDV